jgi:hypothetical protein
MVTFLKKLWCKWDINHWPESVHSESMSISVHGECKFCGCETLMDSQGNHFRNGPRND